MAWASGKRATQRKGGLKARGQTPLRGGPSNGLLARRLDAPLPRRHHLGVLQRRRIHGPGRELCGGGGCGRRGEHLRGVEHNNGAYDLRSRYGLAVVGRGEGHDDEDVALPHDLR
eukprot:CAMPEP_0176289484 /NCGR_PEP_ID=MMETSP0121_2-20121125/54521_1 /TAXON_ID=160619 /ORGANISM="Kryptoperidinium foliaceum, Strain CCMP 1326" /LENGTH=114 /DNA_ID=CAMNT_0017630225 /DNA_START=8 /DNA_END=348 /DNA_ORIENTATION=-